MSNKKVGKIMQKKVISVNGNKTLAGCAQLMKQKKVGSLIITDSKKKIVGIITEQDLARKAVAKNLSPKKHKAKEIMSTKIHTIDPNYSLMEAVALMKNKDIEHLPIVKNGKLVGLISANNVIGKLHSDRYFLLSWQRFLAIIMVWLLLLVIRKTVQIQSGDIRLAITIVGAILIPSYIVIAIIYTIVNRRMERSGELN